MFDLGASWWTFLVRGAAVYLAVLVGLRVVGRRELGQMTPFDLVLILLIANAVQNAMVGTDSSLTGGLLAAATLLVVNRLLAVLRRRVRWVRRVAEGEPVLVVSGGRVLDERLRREGIEPADLEQAAREHGLTDLTQVDMAVLEVDGTLSIIPVTDARIRTRRRLRPPRSSA